MKKIATGIFLILFLFAVEVTYINYRLEQKLNSLELSQQNILTKVYALERTTTQVNQTVKQVLQQQNNIPTSQPNFLLTESQSSELKNIQEKLKVIN